MANISFKVGTLNLSSYLRVNPNEHLELGMGDMIEPAFSDSPFYEGQVLVSTHAKNKELKVPLFLHPQTAPYTNDALNALVQQINQALRPIVDLGQTIYAQWSNAQASNPTFFTIQYGRFEPDFNFRITEKGWLAGILHLWVLPYAHTATERIVGTWSAPANQSGIWIPAPSILALATQSLPASSLATPIAAVQGDVSPQMDIRVTTGSYTGEDGQVGIIAALPVASYAPIIPVGSFFALSPSAVIQGASGAWASQYLAMDAAQAVGASGGAGGFSFALSPASVYQGDNRVLGLVRARYTPFGLQAFDPIGNAIGPTVMATAMDGWQLVDYGTVRIPPWLATAMISIQAYGGIDPTASGMFAPRRAPQTWTKEHGPIFVVPNTSSLLDLDWNSSLGSFDGFDGASGALLGQDALGNTWQGSAAYTGFSAIAVPSRLFPGNNIIVMPTSPNPIANFEIEALINVGSNALTFASYSVGNWNAVGVGILSPFGGNGLYGALFLGPSPYLNVVGVNAAGAPVVGSMGIAPVVGEYHLKAVRQASVMWAALAGPSGSFAGSASGIAASVGVSVGQPSPVQQWQPGLFMQLGGASVTVEAFRYRGLASTGHQSRDALHLQQPLLQNTRMLTASGPDVVDLQARQRGAIQAPILPVPSLGAGLFCFSLGWDQGPANDLLNVDLRLRERFTYAR